MPKIWLTKDYFINSVDYRKGYTEVPTELVALIKFEEARYQAESVTRDHNEYVENIVKEAALQDPKVQQVINGLKGEVAPRDTENVDQAGDAK